MGIEAKLVTLLKNKNLHISFCESCTGGMLVSTLVGVSGASNVLNESYVTYSEEAKKRILDVKEDTLKYFTVYSKEVAYEMVCGLYEKTGCDVCVSVTGLAGGYDNNPNNGKFYFGILYKGEISIFEDFVSGTRNHNRKEMVDIILSTVYDIINN